MPIHPLPIIVGTTLLVSGGIAFKKFVYDPHLAPYIDAFIASHSTTFQSSSSRQAIPVASTASQPTYARTSSLRERAPELRRRRQSRADDYELHETLLPLHEELEPSVPGPLPMPSDKRLQDVDDLSLSSLKRAIGVKRKSSDRPLIDIDRPLSPQDAEVRETIFNLPPTPLRSSSVSTSAATTPMADVTPKATFPPRMPGPDHLSPQLEDQIPPNMNSVPVSTTFSFLSLSQASSPETTNAMLASMSFSEAGEQWGEMSDFAPLPPSRSGHASQLAEADGTRQREVSAESWASINIPSLAADALAPVSSQSDHDDQAGESRQDGQEEDVVSLPETSTSGYIDAESYTPGMLSPIRVHTAFSSPRAGIPVSNDLLTERNLHAVQAIPAVSLDSQGVVVGKSARRGRGQMSVVSLSESEGWGGESDWEGRSDRGLRQ